jgi:Tripartite tricarboxylate transporter TctB family
LREYDAMHFPSRLQRDHYAGGLMILLGLGTLVQASRYQIGSLETMGPGFFPTILGGILLAIGVLIAVSADGASQEPQTSEEFGSPDWRGWFCIILGVLSFIALAQSAGLFPATFACVFISALGDRTCQVRNAFFLALGLAVFGVALFSYGLEIPLPALNW